MLGLRIIDSCIEPMKTVINCVGVFQPVMIDLRFICDSCQHGSQMQIKRWRSGRVCALGWDRPLQAGHRSLTDSGAEPPDRISICQKCAKLISQQSPSPRPGRAAVLILPYAKGLPSGAVQETNLRQKTHCSSQTHHRY